MTNLIMFLVPLVLSNNLLMSLVKWISPKESNLWLRSALVVISILGVVASASLNGNPIDFNQISELGKMLVEVLTIAVASHFSYKAIKNA